MSKMNYFRLHGLLFFLLAHCGFAQNFTFHLEADSISYGQPGGNDIVVQGTLVNTGTTNIEIDIIRKENNLPQNWLSYMCTDVCLAPSGDSLRQYLDVGESQIFKLSFIVNNEIDTANCLIMFKNVANPPNAFKQRMFGITSLTAGLFHSGNKLGGLQIYPIPAAEFVHVVSITQLNEIRCHDAEGKETNLSFENQNDRTRINVSMLPSGLYFIQAIDFAGNVYSQRIIKQ
jgi:hypothetical protein